MGSAVTTFVGGGLLNALGSFINYKSSENIANKQIGAQSDENALNRDWQTHQAELARSYNTSEREAVQAWSEKMLDKQNEYNSPFQQAQRLRAAGINPFIAMGSNGVTSISASPQGSSPGTSPMPSGVSGLSPVSQQPLDLQIPQLMNGVGSFFKNLAVAQKTGLDTSILSRTAESIISSAAADAQYKQTAADFLKIDKDIKEQVKDADIASKWQELGILQGKLLITNSEAERQDLVTQLMKTQKDLNEVLFHKHGAEYGLLMMDIANYNKKLNSLINLQSAQSAESRASASEHAESADQKKLFNKIYGDKRFQHSLIAQAVSAGQKSIQENKMSKQQVEHMNYMIEQAAYANDMKEFSYWSNQIQGYVKSIGEAASAFYGAGALRELIRLRKAQGVTPPAPLLDYWPGTTTGGSSW